jgi:hypothetical protein
LPGPDRCDRSDRPIRVDRAGMDQPGNDVQWYFSESHTSERYTILSHRRVPGRGASARRSFRPIGQDRGGKARHRRRRSDRQVRSPRAAGAGRDQRRALFFCPCQVVDRRPCAVGGAGAAGGVPAR